MEYTKKTWRNGEVIYDRDLNNMEEGIARASEKTSEVEWDNVKNKPENLVQDEDYNHTDNNYDNESKTKVDELKNIKSIGDGLNLSDEGELSATGGGAEMIVNINCYDENNVSADKTYDEIALALSEGTFVMAVATGRLFGDNVYYGRLIHDGVFAGDGEAERVQFFFPEGYWDVDKGLGYGLRCFWVNIASDGGVEYAQYDDTDLRGRVETNETAIGDLADLTTEDKTSLVGALEETRQTAAAADQLLQQEINNRYTKTETDAKIADAMTDVDNEHFHPVTVLPDPADEDPAKRPKENHEYILIEYEQDGTTIKSETHYLFYDGVYHEKKTAVSLDGYATEEFVNTKTAKMGEFDVATIPQGPTGANEINAVLSNKANENTRLSYVRQSDGTLPNTVNLGVMSGLGEDSFQLATAGYVNSTDKFLFVPTDQDDWQDVPAQGEGVKGVELTAPYTYEELVASGKQIAAKIDSTSENADSFLVILQHYDDNARNRQFYGYSAYVDWINGEEHYYIDTVQIVKQTQTDKTWLYRRTSEISGVTVDQTYDATSTNAQSGTAVAQAVAEADRYYRVTITKDAETGNFSADKTFAEIKSQIQQGKVPFAVYDGVAVPCLSTAVDDWIFFQGVVDTSNGSTVHMRVAVSEQYVSVLLRELEFYSDTNATLEFFPVMGSDDYARINSHQDQSMDFNFLENGGLEISTSQGVKRTIATGAFVADGDWRYKINPDNTFEAYYSKSGVSLTIQDTSGNFYRSASQTLTLPAGITSAYDATPLHASVNTSHNNYPCFGTLASVATNQVKYYALSGGSRGASPNYIVTAHVFGTLTAKA